MKTTAKIYIAGHRGLVGGALVRNLTAADHTAAKRDALVKLAGFQTYDHHE
jgi:nucleoside-diphosphate-sugar epimerase